MSVQLHRKRWLWWYAANVVIWGLMILTAMFVPDVEQETDVFLLPLVGMHFLPWLIVLSIIFVVISCYVYGVAHRSAGGVLIFVLSMAGLIIVLTLMGPAMTDITVESVGKETRVMHFQSITHTERIIYDCDRWLLSCDVVEREPAYWSNF